MYDVSCAVSGHTTSVVRGCEVIDDSVHRAYVVHNIIIIILLCCFKEKIKCRALLLRIKRKREHIARDQTLSLEISCVDSRSST